MSRRPPEKLVEHIVGEESEYQTLSDEEITYVAECVLSGQIFGSWMVAERDRSFMHHIFLILSYMDDLERKRLKRDGIVHFYGFYAEQLPRKVHGYPSFMHAKMLDRADSLRLLKRIRQLEREPNDQQSC